MTTFQQALVHAFLVLLAVVAVVVLALTGNLSTPALTIVLAVTGFGSVGVAGVTPTTALPVATATLVQRPGPPTG
jgi:hypothetical protein